jgi:tetratricopeptide (TPR) repeat protein
MKRKGRVGAAQVLALAALAVSVGGCSGLLPLRRLMSGGSNVNTARATQAQNITWTSPDQISTAGAADSASGRGLIVFEPVGTAESGGRSSGLGAGCGRWLHLHAAGQGALGRTPFWGSVDDARRALGFSSLQLGTKEAQAVARFTGATHVAVGKISGAGAAARLSYQIYDAGSGQVFGGPVAASARPEALGAALPEMARQMLARLNVASPVVPARCELSAGELALVGRAPWKYRYGIKAPEVRALQVLAPRSALAGLLWMRLGDLNSSQWASTLPQQVQLAPQNTLVLGDAARQAVLATRPQRAAYDAALAKWPSNFLLQSGQAYWRKHNADRAGDVSHTEAALKSSPQSAFAWTEMSEVLWRVSQDVRQSRYAGQISGGEWRFLNKAYADALACANRAVALAPRDSFAWSNLAQAATFGGDSALADRALWKALALDPANEDAYGWGFQMYQPKWNNDPAKMLKLAKLAGANANRFWVPADDMVAALHATQQQAAKEPILAQIVALDPQNAQALAEYGSCLHYDRRQYRRAEALYRQALAIDPSYSRPTGSLADLLFFVKNDRPAADALYRRAIALSPRTAHHYEDYARFLVRTGRKAQAQTVAAQARKIGTDGTHPVWQELNV